MEKPEVLKLKTHGYFVWTCWFTKGVHEIHLNDRAMTLKHAKKVHNWLGRAIAYLEGKEK